MDWGLFFTYLAACGAAAASGGADQAGALVCSTCQAALDPARLGLSFGLDQSLSVHVLCCSACRGFARGGASNRVLVDSNCVGHAVDTGFLWAETDASRALGHGRALDFGAGNIRFISDGGFGRGACAGTLHGLGQRGGAFKHSNGAPEPN